MKLGHTFTHNGKDHEIYDIIQVISVSTKTNRVSYRRRYMVVTEGEDPFEMTEREIIAAGKNISDK